MTSGHWIDNVYNEFVILIQLCLDKFISIYNIENAIFATRGLFIKQWNKTRNVIKLRGNAEIVRFVYFIVKLPPLKMKICLTDSGRNVHERGDVFMFYSCLPICFLALLRGVTLEVSKNFFFE